MATVYTNASGDGLSEDNKRRINERKDDPNFGKGDNQWSRDGKTEKGRLQGPQLEKSSSKPSSGRGGMSKSEYKAKYGEDYDGMSDSLKKQKKAEEKARKERQKAYNKLYDQMKSDLTARRGEVGDERSEAITGVDNSYNNAMTRADSSRDEMTEFYDDQETDLRDSYADQKKEQARIFQGRNITNSSYYIDAVTKADTAFNETLSSLGKDEARGILEIDTQIKELGEQRMTRKSEIERAYTQVIRQIESDITKTDFEKSEAFARLDEEYGMKMGTIDEQILQIQLQQQAYREKVSGFSVDTGYQNTDYGIDLNTDALKMKTPQGNEAILQALMGTKGSDGFVDPDEYMRLRSTTTGAPGTFNGKYSGYLNPNDTARVMGKQSTGGGGTGNLWEDL